MLRRQAAPNARRPGPRWLTRDCPTKSCRLPYVAAPGTITRLLHRGSCEPTQNPCGDVDAPAKDLSVREGITAAPRRWGSARDWSAVVSWAGDHPMHQPGIARWVVEVDAGVSIPNGPGA